MSLIPRVFINELLSRCDLIGLIDARVPLRKKGNNYTACCPFHNEKTPSFTVSPSKQFYHCFGCGAHGNALSFLMDYDRLSFVEAVEQLANHLGLEVPQEAQQTSLSPTTNLYALMEQATSYYQAQLREHPQAIAYLKQRGLTGQCAKEFRIGYAPAGWDNLLKHIGASKEAVTQLLATGLIIKKADGGYYDRFRDRIMFPIRDRRGRVIAFGGRVISDEQPKYLNSPETPIFHKGRELYGLYEACQAMRDFQRLLVVEGYMDVVALAQHSIRNVVATLGTATTADHIQRLLSVTEEIIFCFDGDRAGQTAAERALEIALSLLQDGQRIQFLFLPEGEDPDSMVRKEGVEQFQARLTQAHTLADFLFATIGKQVDLTTAEGKAGFAQRAVTQINKMSAGVFQHMLFEQLARKVRMEVATLKKLTPPIPMPAKTTTQKQRSGKSRYSPMRLAITLLVQNPLLIQAISEPTQFAQLTLPGSELLNEIITLLMQVSSLNTASLIEYWRERPEHALLMQLASREINIPSEGVEAEFVGILEQLKQLNREQRVDQLLQKANQGQLTDDERQQLHLLITADKSKS